MKLGNGDGLGGVDGVGGDRGGDVRRESMWSLFYVQLETTKILNID